MEAIGYAYGGDHGRAQHVFRKGARMPWDVLVHVVVHGGPMWRDFLVFRDHLRADPSAARRYAELRAALLAERGQWYRGVDKTTFIEPILRRGTSEGGG